MVGCELDRDVSGEILGWKLPTWQALLLHRVLPSCGGLVVYLSLMCFDLALVVEHFQAGDNGIAGFSVVLMILPALLCLTFTLASPPEGLQTDLSAFTISVQTKDLKWIALQFLNALFFPIAVIGRYCYLIFWWVEAVCGARYGDAERTGDAVLRARTHSPLELYLFLQAFIHSAPHAIINILDLMTRYVDPAFDKVTVQSVSIIMSSLRMASTATMYRRFEREKLCGRKYPWHKDYENLIDTSSKKITDRILTPEANTESVYTAATPQISHTDNRDLIQFSPRSTVLDPHTNVDYLSSESDISSDYFTPFQYNPKKSASFVESNSDDEYVRPKSIIDRVAPMRGDIEVPVQRVEIIPPPVMPAPRPGSLALWAEKIVENAESLPAYLSAPPRRRHNNEQIYETLKDEPDIPRRAPRTYMRGLEPQDASAALVHYLGCYTFFVARLLSIAAFINFHPVAAIIVLFSHYQVMLLLLIVPQASSVKRSFYLFLAFIYLFCLMEFKVRFRHVRVWHVFWAIVCTVEIVLFTSVWATVNNNVGDWWRLFVVKVTIGSMLMSYTFFLVYFVLLKPRETIVYITKPANGYSSIKT